MSAEPTATPQPNPWESGDYPRLARRLEPAALAVAAAAGPGHGRAALDVAAGDGSVALALHEAGWSVAATDGAAAMVEQGRTRCPDAVAWSQADLTSQPVADRSVDLVASSFGLIFAPDPEAAVAEVARVLRPGGRLVLSAWTDDGYMAEMTGVVTSFFPPPHFPGPFRWGSETFVRALLDPWCSRVDVTARHLPWSFGSAREARLLMETASPGHLAAIAALGDAAPAMMDAVEAHLEATAAPDGSVSVEASYLLVEAHLRRR